MKTRNERFDMTLSAEEKMFLNDAAEMEGFASLSQFIRTSMMRISRKIQYAHQELISSKEDRDKFKELIMNPPEPNEALVNLLTNEGNPITKQKAQEKQL